MPPMGVFGPLESIVLVSRSIWVKMKRMSAIKALIIDDEPIARKVLHDELDEFADVVVVGEAGNGRDALSLIRSLQPDLILLDLEMPAIGGFEVIAQLPDSSRPHIIVVSACADCSRMALRAGASAYLLKPVSQTSLRETIDLLRTPPINRDAELPVAPECRHRAL